MPGAIIGFFIMTFICLLIRQRLFQRLPIDLLDTVLFSFSPRDAFTVRHLLNGGVIILGRPGSGKTSSSGKTLMRSIVANERSGMLISASKPEEKAEIVRIFTEAGRQDDLVVVEPGGQYRIPLFEYMSQSGADARAMTHFIMTIGESLRSGDGRGGGEDDGFFQQMNERCIYDAVVIVKLATGKISPPDLHRFINSAAVRPEQLTHPGWQQDSFHSQCLKAAYAKVKGVAGIETDDVLLAIDGWLGEWPQMADRTRSSVLAGINSILHTATTGLVRAMMSGGSTSITPEVMFSGKTILLNMPVSEYGPAGAFIGAGLRYVTQQAVLRREAKAGDCINVIWLDEFQQTINSFDYQYLAQCRSHLGCMVCLTQSIPGLIAALKGQTAKSQAEALLAAFATKIFHACDPQTAEYGSSSIGKTSTLFFGGSMSPEEDIWDAIGFGRSRFTGSFSEHVESIVQPSAFMSGLRTGGVQVGRICDAIVIRNGEPFNSNGQNFLQVAFSQR